MDEIEGESRPVDILVDRLVASDVLSTPLRMADATKDGETSLVVRRVCEHEKQWAYRRKLPAGGTLSVL